MTGAFHEAVQAAGGGGDKNAAGQQFLAAKAASESASQSLKVEREPSKRFSNCHAEAYDRLMAAKKDAASPPDTPSEFQFAETVPSIPPPTVQRSKSKRYKFESTFDGWRREVDEAFTNYAAIESFPSPPGRCRGIRCPADGKAHTCRCVIREAFSRWRIPRGRSDAGIRRGLRCAGPSGRRSRRWLRRSMLW